jgi:hypothetical protein
MSTASCNATSADLCWTRGDSGRLDVTVTQSDGTAYDLTGATLFLTVKNALADADSLATIRKEVTAHDAPEGGESHFDILTTDNATAGTRFYDVQLVTGTGDVFTLFGGVWRVLGDVTARTQSINSLLVAGAGTTTSNGIYTEDGEEFGKKKYTAESGNFIRWSGSRWELFDFAEDETLYDTTAVDTAAPWDATWRVANGAAPAPTVTPVII